MHHDQHNAMPQLGPSMASEAASSKKIPLQSQYTTMELCSITMASPPPHTRSLRHSARPLVTRRVNSHSCTSHRHVSSGCNSSWTVPQGIGYHQHLNTGEVSVSVLSRVQASSTLSAATIDRVPFFANRFLNKLIGFHTRLSTWVVQGPEYPLSSSL